MAGLLADTYVLLSALDAPERLPAALREELEDPDTHPSFSVISIWEIAIKANLGRPDFEADASLVRKTLLQAGWSELDFDGRHALVAGALPRLHADPFDRALIGQAIAENVELVTADRALEGYGSLMRLI